MIAFVICLITVVAALLAWAPSRSMNAIPSLSLGKLTIQLGGSDRILAQDVDGEGIADAPLCDLGAHAFLGFAWIRYCPVDVIYYVSGFPMSAPPPTCARLLVVPVWFFATVCGLLPITTAIALRGRRPRKLIGACFTCGYDLRASKNRCPECGRVFRRTEAALP